jgi:hypothetical protein
MHSLPECCRSATMPPWSLWSTRLAAFLADAIQGNERTIRASKASICGFDLRLRSAPAHGPPRRRWQMPLRNACQSSVEVELMRQPRAPSIPAALTCKRHNPTRSPRDRPLNETRPPVPSPPSVGLSCAPRFRRSHTRVKMSIAAPSCHAPVTCKPQAWLVPGGAGTSGGRMPLLGGVTHVRVRATCVCCRPFLMPRAALFFVLIKRTGCQ